MTLTPLATPVAIAPAQCAPVSERVPRTQLLAPILVVTTTGEYELKRGQLILGRNPEANIVIEDSLVSRLHGRLAVDLSGRVTLEDLRSTNGIYVNGVRLSRPSVVLSDGDRFLMGTTEVSVFAIRRSDRAEPGERVARLPQTSGAIPEPTRMPSPRALAVTGRSDAVSLVGQFAEQLMGSGHPLEAARVLTEHLQNLMKGASAGLNVPPNLLESATLYALKLHRWTQRVSFIDYVFELHLASLQVPSDFCLTELETVLNATPTFDTSLLDYFTKTIERRPDPLSIDETRRLRRIEQLSRMRARV